MVGSGECYKTSQRIHYMLWHGLAISVDGGVVLPNKTVRGSPLWVRRQNSGFWLYCAFVAMLVRDLIMLCAACQSYVDCVTVVIYWTLVKRALWMQCA